MQFDFNEQYKHYSDTELLKIKQQPDAYQPEALEAAVRILKERGVTEEKAKTLTLQEDTVHLLDSFDLKEEIKPLPPLLVFFLITVAMEYLWKFYGELKIFPFDQVLNNISFTLFILFDIVYTPFVFFLLFKRKPWGWILLFISIAMSAITRVMRFDIILQYVGLDTLQGLTYIGITLLKLAFTYYLWRKEIPEFFHVTKKVKFWTSVAAIGLLVIGLLSKLATVSGGINSF